jgi:hypothetical protein
MICICAKEDDPHAMRVSDILKARHAQDVFVLDTSRFPEQMSLSATFGNGRRDYRIAAAGIPDIPLQDIQSIWWRRPQPMALNPRMSDAAARTFAYQECVSALYGVLGCCDALWVNDLQNDAAAEYKPYQLKVAGDVGFRIPSTIVTNEPARVLEFWEHSGGAVVYKAFNQRGMVWRPTRILTREDATLIDHVRHAPVIFQTFVPGVRDIRVTVVGPVALAAEFDIERLDVIDHRVRMADLPCRMHQLPQQVEARVLALMRRFGLEYAGIDLRVTPDGDYVFFEINTAGEFLYVQDRAALPIAEELAAFLARGKASGSQPTP